MTHHRLDSYIEAARDDQGNDDQSAGAQRRLVERLDEVRRKKHSPVRDWGLATAAMLMILLIPLMLLLPGSNGGVAFAEVQSFFSDFQTMRARMTTQMNGNTVLEMDIEVDGQRRTRLDSGDDFSLIIDPNQQAMLQLFHRHQHAVRVPLQGEGRATPAQHLDWLARLREYQGRARLIDEVRTIDGIEVFGFRLTDQAVDMTLWASQQARPVLLEMNAGPEAAAATTQIQFSFDQPVNPERFSLTVPEGYAVHAGGDADPD